MNDCARIVEKANRLGTVIPSFNVPYLPMVEPVVRAVAAVGSFAFVATARLEWHKFEAGGPEAVFEEYAKWKHPAHTRLHLDHVPVIDEDGERVDYAGIIGLAVKLGYDSVMVDGSRLSLDDNISSTKEAVEIAHAAGVPCEAELGAVMGHEAGPLPPYEELFASGRGFTDPDETVRFVRETGCDWLSVAVGNIHGAVSGAARDKKKVEARLNISHLRRLGEAADIPLVLHGGSGVRKEHVLDAIRGPIAKINVGTEIRQPYEQVLAETHSVEKAQEAVFERTSWVITDWLGITGNARELCAGEGAS